MWWSCFFVKQKTAYEVVMWLEFRRVLFRSAGDGGGARAAIRLQHVAIDGDGALAERLEVRHRPERAADQPLDLLGAPALQIGRASCRDRVQVSARAVRIQEGRSTQVATRGG